MIVICCPYNPFGGDETMKTALLVVDLQNDFMEGGVLAAKDTLSLINPLNKFIEKWAATDSLCVFTRDWHPADHWSFKTQGGPWPVHCVANTPGAEFYPGVIVPPNAWMVDKGVDKQSIGYSDFGSTHLQDKLITKGINDLAVCGIATEYCIRADVLDALALKFCVTVLVDLIRPIEAQSGDAERVLSGLAKVGAKMVESKDWKG